ncbi:MAG: AEC family transporter, partial [Synergistaceae bacterium]|nr:AEC family transporter [Synergistaceae bacterium]
LKNPMIIATSIAFVLMALPYPFPPLLWGVVRDVAGVTTPLSFISLGVGLDLGKARADLRPLTLGVLLRTVLVPSIFLPLSVMLGYSGPTLCALLILFGAPTAVASYPMAVAMGADGPLAGQLVCATTLLSIPTIFLATFALLSLGLL